MRGLSKIKLLQKCFGKLISNADGATCCHQRFVSNFRPMYLTPKRDTSTNIVVAAAAEAAPIAKESSLKNPPNINTTNVAALTDTFGRHHTYLRISLTERCNLRCQYCMPAEGVTLQPKSNLLTTDEIIYLARIFVEQGVRKIRLTGGEPTVRRDIIDIIQSLKSIPKLENVGITTNGLVLTRQLLPMQRAGLDSVNISLDTLRPKRFEEITRRKGWERVIAGIDLAVQLGYTPKINCVLMRNFNEDEVCDFVEFTKDRKVDVRFIEYMPFTGNKWQTDKLISFRETLALINKKWPDFAALPNGPNDTSKAYKVPGFAGQVGFITSMTEHFCGTCNRLRLTADGNIKVCLFGNKEFSLRDAIRSKCAEEDLIALISSAVKRKQKQHAASTISLNCLTNQLQKSSGTPKWHKHQSFAWNYNSKIKQLLGHQHDQKASSSLQCQSKYYSTSSTTNTQLTHVDGEGKATMVDVSAKEITKREAIACATVEVGAELTKLIAENSIKKGDVLTVAQLAGILGAKKTSDLIPLCHNIPLSSVKVQATLDQQRQCVQLQAKVCCSAQTGVEMESLTAVAIAALTVYDMCKAVSHEIRITNIQLLKKTGGKSDYINSGRSV